jgi:nitrogen fixation protein FixH
MPLPADRVALRFSFPGGTDLGESTLELRPAGRGLYRAAGANLALAGPWNVTVLVQRGVDSVEVPLLVGTLCRTREVTAPPPQPTIYLSELSPDVDLESFVTVGLRTSHEIHFTFIDPSMDEEVHTQASAVMTAWQRGEEPTILRGGQLSPGHFVAEANLDPGPWRFDIAAKGKSGDALSGCFEATIP